MHCTYFIIALLGKYKEVVSLLDYSGKLDLKWMVALTGGD